MEIKKLGQKERQDTRFLYEEIFSEDSELQIIIIPRRQETIRYMQ